ncbi:MAG: hypothetical protein ACR2H2_03305 [Solirubrobacteraceae bacterium]
MSTPDDLECLINESAFLSEPLNYCKGLESVVMHGLALSSRRKAEAVRMLVEGDLAWEAGPSLRGMFESWLLMSWFLSSEKQYLARRISRFLAEAHRRQMKAARANGNDETADQHKSTFEALISGLRGDPVDHRPTMLRLVGEVARTHDERARLRNQIEVARHLGRELGPKVVAACRQMGEFQRRREQLNEEMLHEDIFDENGDLEEQRLLPSYMELADAANASDTYAVLYAIESMRVHPSLLTVQDFYEPDGSGGWQRRDGGPTLTDELEVATVLYANVLDRFGEFTDLYDDE